MDRATSHFADYNGDVAAVAHFKVSVLGRCQIRKISG